MGCPQAAGTNTPIDDPLFQYGNDVPYGAGDIESDFDLRRATGASRWHKGLDLRNHGQGADMQRGDAIISPENGTIVSFSKPIQIPLRRSCLYSLRSRSFPESWKFSIFTGGIYFSWRLSNRAGITYSSWILNNPWLLVFIF